jgi:4-hydroxy-tetrahydrodipicolinate synthase
MRGEHERADALDRWLLPLLRMDTGGQFVQLTKLAQARVGMGSARVRAPRLPLAGDELREANAVIDEALATRPSLAANRAEQRLTA